jgi:hypothetical protein
MADFSIASQVRPVQLPDQLQQFGQFNQIALQQAQMARAQSEAEAQNRLRSLDRNSPEFLNQLYAIDPAKGMAFEKGVADLAEAKRKRGEAAYDRGVAAKKEAELARIFGGSVNNLAPPAPAASANSLVAPAAPAAAARGPSAGAIDWEGTAGKLIAAGYVEEAKKFADFGKTFAESQGKATEASVARMKAAYDPIQTLIQHVATPADVEAYTRRIYSDPILGPEASRLKSVDQAVQDNLDLVNKVGLDQWKARNSNMDAKQLHDLVTTATAPKIEKVDRGGSIVFMDMNPKSPTYKQTLDEIQKTLTPAQGAKEMPPTVRLAQGEVWNSEAGRVDAVPGSAAYIKRSQEHASDVTALNAVKEKTDEAIVNINKMLHDENKEGFQANFGGMGTTVTSRMAGKPKDFKGMLDTFKSNMKSAGLEMMRSGGSIGAMTEKEWPIVEAEMASLDGWMTEENARNVMRNVAARLARIKKTSENVYDMTWSETQFHPKNKTAPSAAATPDRPPIGSFGGK